jgi:hypothetical protein
MPPEVPTAPALPLGNDHVRTEEHAETPAPVTPPTDTPPIASSPVDELMKPLTKRAPRTPMNTLRKLFGRGKS